MERDLPEGVADAEPAGGWESGEGADESTREANAQAWGSTSLADATLPADDAESSAVDPDTSRAASMPDGEPAADPFVESAEIQQGLDPDIVTDEGGR